MSIGRGEASIYRPQHPAWLFDRWAKLNLKDLAVNARCGIGSLCMLAEMHREVNSLHWAVWSASAHIRGRISCTEFRGVRVRDKGYDQDEEEAK
jgi:hypothetical protein